MLLDRAKSGIRHETFAYLLDFLKPGDLLVLNDTRVIPARLYGRKESGGKVEIFLVERLSPDASEWECMSKSSRPLKSGTKLLFDGGLTGELLTDSGRTRTIRFHFDGELAAHLEKIGHVPLPPYIDRQDKSHDRDRYQTVFAREDGALAAPTAGLHFTTEIIAGAMAAGVDVHYVTLHVGLGTFVPVQVEHIPDHTMHEERYVVSTETAAAITQAKREGRRVIAVGTTVARTLESVFDAESGSVRAGAGKTAIFIYPGYRFRAVDVLLTNFHLPKSTLLMLVSAFAGRDFIMQAYQEAIAAGYRFYSYGDCMLIQ